jgi:hypothetical protein
MVSIAQIIEVLAAADIHAVAAVLDGIAERSTNPEERKAYLRSGRALYQQQPGRPTDNALAEKDRILILQAKPLIEGGASVNAALEQVASTVARDATSMDTIVRRLRRKLKKTSDINIKSDLCEL